MPGAAESILSTLEILGFEWTESIVRQSERDDLYEAAWQRLLTEGSAYWCSCSRSEIQSEAGPGTEELRYPGYCRGGARFPDRPLALRLLVADGGIGFEDRIQGLLQTNVAADVGDFVIRRRDGISAYQLAVVVDDADQGITHIVRGADLLSSTPRQILLQRRIGLPTPEYAHVPVATDSHGIKLSKSAGAAAVDLTRPGQELWRALRFLGQEPPVELSRAAPATIWTWAIEHWRLEPLRHRVSARAPGA